ncbi:MAG: Hpt domain-containing protein, partial [Betaproteobacteria bacterium]
AQELVANAKDHWLKFTSGRREALPAVAQNLQELKTLAGSLHEPALVSLVDALIAAGIAVRGGDAPESLAIEFATGLLLAEDALGHFARLSDEFPQQVEAMRRRLELAQRGEPSLSAEADLLDDMARRAQERMLLSQVAREIQGNLRHIEKVLDAFFRDAGERGELAGLAAYTRQIQGALNMLGLSEANELLQLCQGQIDRYAEGAAAATEDLEMLAESLSGLGFYIEAVEQQRPDAARLLEPILHRRLGIGIETSVERTTHSIESDLEAKREDLPATLARVRAAPQDPGLRAELSSQLQTLKHDAELVADTAFAEHAARALAALHDEAATTAELLARLDQLAPQPLTATPEPSAETVRLMAVGEAKLDAELSDIFLTEAGEVLAAVDEHLRLCESNSDDSESMRAIRRGFHTLKGSGRMVGLLELGETAYTVEKVLNRWLDEERAAAPELLALLHAAQGQFRHWVAELKSHGAVQVDDRSLIEAIAAIDAAYPPLGAPVGLVSAAAHVADQTVLRPVTSALDDATTQSTAETIEVEVPAEFDVDLPLSTTAERVREEEQITVGDVRISASLYKVLLEETAQHLQTLDNENESLQFDPHAVPSVAIARAAHTLTGIHRTAGFTVVADTAHALENALLSLQQLPLRPDTALPTLADAALVLAELADTVGMRQPFGDAMLRRAADVRSRLADLHAAGSTADSETLAAQAAFADELAQPQEADAGSSGSEAATVYSPIAASRVPDGEQEPIVEASASEDSAEPAQPAAEMGLPAEPELTAERFGSAHEEAVATPSLVADDATTSHIETLPAPVTFLERVTPPSGVDAPAAREVAAETAELARVEPQRARAELLASVRDDLDPQLLPIFLEEAHELFPHAGALLRDWRRSPNQREYAQNLRRTLHTLKGSARMAGAMRLGEMTHLMESRLMVGEREVAPSTELFDALDDDLDQQANLIDQLQNPTSAGVKQAVLAAEDGVAPTSETAVASIFSTVPPAAATSATVAGLDEPAGETDVAQRMMVRVRSDVIDRLVNETGEVSIARARIEGELRSLKGNLLELTNSVIRLRGQVREIEIQAETQIQSRMSLVPEEEGFDPLEFDRYTRFQELTRSLAEGVNDVSTVQQALLKNLDDADAALTAQARLSRDVQQQLLAVRTVPFASLSERLYRILRQTAKELNKKTNLEIRGGQTELDRGVLEKLVGPLEHLLRNAIDHGIEDRAARVAASKSETGELAITVRQEGNEIALTLADDGRGLPLEEIKSRAVASGLFAADVEPTQAQLIEAIFAPGLTTAQEVTQISGRGIGMDVVKNTITGLGGRVEVATTPGKGTTFTLYLPLTLAVTQAVLVRAGGRIHALPSALVEQVQQIKSDALETLYAAREVRWQTRFYPFFYLPQLLGDELHHPEPQRYNPVLLLKSANKHVAIHVDEMVGNQEIVIKNIGAQLARLPGLAGATVLGTGEIVLILNPVQLLARQLRAPTQAAANEADASGGEGRGRLAVVQPPQHTPHVLVVDDSLTVRKITSRLLIREGYKVGTARDGVDALQLLTEQVADVILLDIEMPRMDGFEFAKTVKNDPRLKSIPIIMITSRTAEKHRARAAELGVEVYLGKPFQEDELLAHIRRITTAQSAARVSADSVDGAAATA